MVRRNLSYIKSYYLVRLLTHVTHILIFEARNKISKETNKI